MLSSSSLPKCFWAEAVVTVVHLINRSPIFAIYFKNPQKMLYGKLVGYDHLKIFGCVAYIYINEEKLEPRTLKCIFIGYPEGVKGYNFWIDELGIQNCLVSRDVVINESQMTRSKKHTFEVEHLDLDQLANDVQIDVENKIDLIDQETKKTKKASEISSSNLNRIVELTYNLVRDKERRIVKPPQRYGQADLLAFALKMANEVV